MLNLLNLTKKILGIIRVYYTFIIFLKQSLKISSKLRPASQTKSSIHNCLICLILRLQIYKEELWLSIKISINFVVTKIFFIKKNTGFFHKILYIYVNPALNVQNLISSFWLKDGLCGIEVTTANLKYSEAI